MRERLTLAMLLYGCGPVVATPSSGDDVTDGIDATDWSGSTTSPSSTTSTSGPTTAMPTTAATTGTTEPTETSDTSDASSSTSTGATFIRDPETSGCLSSCECSVWDQDCPDGEKCMPWANDGGNAWNATRCSTIDPSGGAPGDPCVVEGVPASGIDSCVESAMCWNFDADTLEGECIAFCEGSENSPSCADPDALCMIANEGTLILCVAGCDPLAPTCDEGEACYLFDDTWLCLPSGAHVSTTSGVGLIPSLCPPGETAVDPARISACAPFPELCCAQICDVNAPACAPPLNCVAAIEGSNAGLCVD